MRMNVCIIFRILIFAGLLPKMMIKDELFRILCMEIAHDAKSCGSLFLFRMTKYENVKIQLNSIDSLFFFFRARLFLSLFFVKFTYSVAARRNFLFAFVDELFLIIQ